MATTKTSANDRDLLRMKPGTHPVITCYLKLEPRDRVRRKYLVKVKNRIKELEYALPSMRWTKEQQEAIKIDLAVLLEYLRDVKRLPETQGVAIFLSSGAKLFEMRPLPRVHRSRLAVDRTPFVRRPIDSKRGAVHARQGSHLEGLAPEERKWRRPESRSAHILPQVLKEQQEAIRSTWLSSWSTCGMSSACRRLRASPFFSPRVPSSSRCDPCRACTARALLWIGRRSFGNSRRVRRSSASSSP